MRDPQDSLALIRVVNRPKVRQDSLHQVRHLSHPHAQLHYHQDNYHRRRAASQVLNRLLNQAIDQAGNHRVSHRVGLRWSQLDNRQANHRANQARDRPEEKLAHRPLSLRPDQADSQALDRHLIRPHSQVSLLLRNRQ